MTLPYFAYIRIFIICIYWICISHMPGPCHHTVKSVFFFHFIYFLKIQNSRLKGFLCLLKMLLHWFLICGFPHESLYASLSLCATFFFSECSQDFSLYSWFWAGGGWYASCDFLYVFPTLVPQVYGFRIFINFQKLVAIMSSNLFVFPWIIQDSSFTYIRLISVVPFHVFFFPYAVLMFFSQLNSLWMISIIHLQVY